MPETETAAETVPRRRRPTILTLMAAVALVAGGLGFIRARMVAAERARVARLRTELALADARLRWTLAMRQRAASRRRRRRWTVRSWRGSGRS